MSTGTGEVASSLGIVGLRISGRGDGSGGGTTTALRIVGLGISGSGRRRRRCKEGAGSREHQN